ncbi:MAG: hypothetical protein M3008_00480 [Chloroflexota bacterium]|nr:hypothetical protein [Chloroflexota bacterium]
MQVNQLYDAASITARCSVQDLLDRAAREHMLHDRGRITSHRAPIAKIGHLLVRLGQWLQMLSQQPIYQEETV